MQKDYESSASTPFHEKADPENFFSGGGCGEVLAGMQESVALGIPLLLLTGEGGSGKTMLCTMLAQEMDKDCVVVHFPQTVESFEDVVLVIANKLGITTVEIGDGKGLRDAIEKITELLLGQNLHLLLICDEAENIYLATLERIRKMLGQMTEAGVYLHVLFSGRPAFIENYEQLTICDFRQVEEKYFSLESLSEADTVAYLTHCARRMTVDGHTEMLSEEVIDKIASIANGNFKTANSLAAESIVIPGDDSSFMVLLDSVADGESETKNSWRHFLETIDFKRFRPLIPWLGAIACIALVLVLVFSPADEKTTNTIVSPEEIVEKQPLEPVVATEPEPEPVVPLTATTKTIVTVEKIVVIDEGRPVADEINVTQPKIEVRGPDVEEKNNLVKKEVKKPGEQVPLAGVVTEKQRKTEKQIEVLSSKKEITIVELRQSPALKRKVVTPGPVIETEIPIQSHSEVQQVIAMNSHLTVDQLYKKRIEAAREWTYGKKDNMYTIQLMALTSKEAERNLKQMLAEKDYRQQATQFFIFRRHSSPTVLFVFYGEYKTIAQARKMRKNIPVFLQKHKPYAISIKGAVAKVQKW